MHYERWRKQTGRKSRRVRTKPAVILGLPLTSENVDRIAYRALRYVAAKKDGTQAVSAFYAAFGIEDPTTQEVT